MNELKADKEWSEVYGQFEDAQEVERLRHEAKTLADQLDGLDRALDVLVPRSDKKVEKAEVPAKSESPATTAAAPASASPVTTTPK